MTLSRGSREWQEIQDKEDLKALVAELRRLRADIERHTLYYNPLNADESLDSIYRLVRRMEPDLEKLYELLLKDWEESVLRTRESDSFNEKESAELESHWSIVRTRKMGRTIKGPGGRGRWKRTTTP